MFKVSRGLFPPCFSLGRAPIITDVSVLHGADVWSEPAVGVRDDSLRLLVQLVQLHRKACEVVHLRLKIHFFLLKHCNSLKST